MPKPKGIAIILEKMGKKSEEGSVDENKGSDFKALAKELLSAIQNDDVSALAKFLKNFQCDCEKGEM